MDHRIRLRLRHDDTVSEWVEADFDPKWEEVIVRFDRTTLGRRYANLQVEIVRPPRFTNKQQLTTEVTE